ncbi:MAG TPA: hypothetical protein VGQ93_17650, partial [Lysobacter sp.]|nr:hypothetical protein [Lysobacter sp.]
RDYRKQVDANVATTMIYTHVLKIDGGAASSSADSLPDITADSAWLRTWRIVNDASGAPLQLPFANSG